MQHAKLSPSSSERWLNCPGSVKAEQEYTSIYGDYSGSKYAEEGTRAHSLGEICLKTNKDPELHIGDTIEGQMITEDMAKAVQYYVDYVRNIEGELFVETKVDLRKYIPEGFGTCDAHIINENTLHVIDYKHGMGVKVSSENNTQMMIYALGLLQDNITGVTLHIVQPRVNNSSKWSLTATELKVFGEEVRIKAAKTKDPKAKRIPSQKACTWCKAKATCSELIGLSESLIAMDFDNLDEEKIIWILDNEKTILSHLDSVREHALVNVPKGYKIVQGRTNKKWLDEKQAATLLGEQAYEKKLISPTQALKLKLLPQGVEELIYKPEGAPKLVKDDDFDSLGE